MNTPAFRSSFLLIALTAALLGTAFATTLPATADATVPYVAIDISLASGPEWSVFLAP